MIYKNIWISTRSHLGQFVEIYNSTSKFRRAISAYKIPSGYPHLSFYSGLLKAPIIYTGVGTLDISEESIVFIGKDSFGKKKIEFIHHKSVPLEISRHLFISPFSRFFKTNWINIRTKDSSNEILLSQGMIGFNLNYKEKTEEIYNSLLTLNFVKKCLSSNANKI